MMVVRFPQIKMRGASPHKHPSTELASTFLHKDPKVQLSMVSEVLLLASNHLFPFVFHGE